MLVYFHSFVYVYKLRMSIWWLVLCLVQNWICLEGFIWWLSRSRLLLFGTPTRLLLLSFCSTDPTILWKLKDFGHFFTILFVFFLSKGRCCIDFWGSRGLYHCDLILTDRAQVFQNVHRMGSSRAWSAQRNNVNSFQSKHVCRISFYHLVLPVNEAFWLGQFFILKPYLGHICDYLVCEGIFDRQFVLFNLLVDIL